MGELIPFPKKKRPPLPYTHHRVIDLGNGIEGEVFLIVWDTDRWFYQYKLHDPILGYTFRYGNY